MTSDAQTAANILLEAWRRSDVIDELPNSCRPEDLDSGYAVQDAFVAATGEAVLGYKIAATSKRGQSHIGIDHPIHGRMLASRVLRDGARVSIESNRMRVAEAEFIFAFASGVAARAEPYDWPEVMAHVGDMHLGIELPDSRFNDFAVAGAPQLVADNACASWLIRGPAVAEPWRDRDLSRQPTQLIVDDVTLSQGVGADALGDPRFALTWLVNRLSGAGIAIEQGQIVTTGVCGAPAPIAPGQQVIADFADFGRASVTV